MSACPLVRRSRCIVCSEWRRRACVLKWCTTATQMMKSAHSSLRPVLSKSNRMQSAPDIRAVSPLHSSSRPLLLSPATCNISVLLSIFLPLPQPRSSTIDPAGTCCMKSTTLGQGLCRVVLKCPAICSYTWCTCMSSMLDATSLLIVSGILRSMLSHNILYSHLHGPHLVHRNVKEILISLCTVSDVITLTFSLSIKRTSRTGSHILGCIPCCQSYLASSCIIIIDLASTITGTYFPV